MSNCKKKKIKIIAICIKDTQRIGKKFLLHVTLNSRNIIIDKYTKCDYFFVLHHISLIFACICIDMYIGYIVKPGKKIMKKWTHYEMTHCRKNTVVYHVLFATCSDIYV